MIWLIGNKGMLGRQIERELKARSLPCVATDREVDIVDPVSLKKFADDNPVAWIINCAAYTAVDKAETEENTAFKINAEGTRNIGNVAVSIGARVIHFSTDYVFDGTSSAPYRETDLPNPIGAYGRSKFQGENLLRETTRDCFIFRISRLYGIFGPNFVKTMVRLMNERENIQVVNDQIGSPTFCGVLAVNLAGLIESDSKDYGIYHYSDDGFISWYDFAREIQKSAVRHGLIKKEISVIPISTFEFPTPAKRPLNSRLDKEKVVSRLGFSVKPWKVNLEAYFDELDGGK